MINFENEAKKKLEAKKAYITSVSDTVVNVINNLIEEEDKARKRIIYMHLIV